MYQRLTWKTLVITHACQSLIKSMFYVYLNYL